MTAIALNVEQVVQKVVGGGYEAETKEGGNGRGNCLREQLVREQERHEQENILGPLMDADGLPQRTRQRLLVQKDTGDGDVPETQREAQARCGVGHHDEARVGKQRQISAGVADVVEYSKAGFQRRQFRRAAQVGHSVRGQHAVKDAQVRCHTLRQ